MKQKSLSFLVMACLFVGAVPLSSCTQVAALFNSHGAKPAHAPRTSYDADTYVSNLTLSRLALSANPELPEEASHNVALVNDYAAQKKRKTEKLTLIVIDYKTKNDSSVRQIIAPAKANKPDFASLQSILDTFGSTGTIHNIRLASVSVRPDKSLILPKDNKQLMPALDRQQEHLLAQSHNLDMADDIKTQLALIEFFTKGHFQDAAYLSVDNVKRMLGKAVQGKTIDEASLQSFSKDLESKESSLKEALPYKL